MRRLSMIAVLVAVAGLVLGACGNDKPRLTQAEFVKQGNAICKAGNERISAAAEKAFPNASEQNPPTAEQFATFATETAIPNVVKQVDAIDDLKPPKDVEAKVDEAVKEARGAIEKAKANPAALADDTDTTFDKANELIAATGLDVCAEKA